MSLRAHVPGTDTADEVNPSQISSILPRFNPGKKFKQMLKMIEYTRGILVTEPEPQAGD